MGLRASEDNGASWRPADLKLAGSTVSVISTDAEGEQVFAASGNVCMSYAAGGRAGWSDAGPGITGGDIRSLSVDPSVQGLVYATTTAACSSPATTAGSWQAAPRSLEISPYLFEAHPSIKHGCSWPATRDCLFRPTAGARGFNPGLSATAGPSMPDLQSLTNAGTIIGATSNSGVIISRDGGFTWEPARYGITGDRVVLVALDDSDPDTYYAYMPDGDCYRSLNKGLEWNRYSPPWKRGESVLLSADPRVPSSIVALVDNRQVYYSPSGGGTWFRVSSPTCTHRRPRSAGMRLRRRSTPEGGTGGC